MLYERQTFQALRETWKVCVCERGASGCGASGSLALVNAGEPPALLEYDL